MKEIIKKDQKIKPDNQGKSEIVLEKDGIINIKIGKDVLKSGGMKRGMNDLNECIKNAPGKVHILIEVGVINLIKPPEWRREVMVVAKDILKNPKVGKMAIYGGGLVMGAATAFVVGLIGQPSIYKMFKTEKEARKWLKE